MKKLLLSLIALFSAVGAWAEGEVIKGITTMPTVATKPASIETGYYLLKEVNPNMGSAKGNGGFLKAEYEIPTAAVRPIGRTTELAADAVEATHIWYIEKTDQTYTIASANKVAAWNTPDRGRKDLVAYSNKASFNFVTDAFTLGNQTTTPAEGAFVITKTDGSATFHCEGNYLASWDDGNPASVMVFEAYKIEESNLVKGVPETVAVGQKFRIKSAYSGYGYLVYSAAEGKQVENNPTMADGWAAFPKLSDEGVHSEWALIENGGNKYLYNVDKKEFVTNSNGIKFCGVSPAVCTFVDQGSNKWNIKLGDGNMHISPGYGLSGAVMTGSATSEGSQFYLLPTGENVSDDVQAEMAERLTELGVWKYNTLSTLGYVGCYEKSEAMQTNIKAISNEDEKASFISENETKKVTLGEGYYHIIHTGEGTSCNAKPGWYATYKLDNGVNKFYALTPGTVGFEHLMKLEADGSNYKIKVCNLGKYVDFKQAGPASEFVESKDAGTSFVLADTGDGKYTFKNTSGNSMRTETDGKINYWSNHCDYWYLEPVDDANLSMDVEIGAAGYATAYLPFDATLPTGLEAYAVTAAGSSATLTPVDYIKAHEGVILKGDATTYTLKVGTATSDFSSNLLEGSCINTYVEGDGYVLAMKESVVGLYKAMLNKDATGAESTTHFLNNSFKAYLPASAVSVNAPFFHFDFGYETGIENIESTESANSKPAIYDLSGRRVQNPKKGIYIVNGKKVVL